MHTVTELADWLTTLGVTPESLSAGQREQLERDGFVRLVGHLPDQLLTAFRDRTDELLAQEGGSAGHETPQGGGVAALANLLNKGEIFHQCMTDPAVLAAARQVLGHDFKVNSLNYRASLPGQGHQGLHADWDGAVPAGDFHILNSMWCLDDFTDDNGATRAVPGSHNWQRTPTDDLGDPTLDHPDQVLLTAPAGSVIIFNAHLWHGGTRNTTDQRRRGMTMSFVRRSEPQQLDQRAHIRKVVYDQLSPAERYLLDV